MRKSRNAPNVRIFASEQLAAVARILKLSSRETEIALLIVDDATEAEIAFTLEISRHTVHTYVKRLFHKTKVTSRRQLVVRLFSLRDTIKEGGG